MKVDQNKFIFLRNGASLKSPQTFLSILCHILVFVRDISQMLKDMSSKDQF
jgi:hypothetical protein